MSAYEDVHHPDEIEQADVAPERDTCDQRDRAEGMLHDSPEIKQLCARILAIPARNNSERMNCFVHHALSRLTFAINQSHGMQSGFAQGLLEGADMTSAQRDACVIATQAYLVAVKNSDPMTDVLTLVHANMLATTSGEGLGQFFTPTDLAQLVGVLASGHTEQYPRKSEGVWSIYDCACGAGSLVLGYLFHLDRSISISDVVIHSVDIDPLCCGMTALQLAANTHWHNATFANANVWCGNALLHPDTWQKFHQIKRKSDVAVEEVEKEQRA